MKAFIFQVYELALQKLELDILKEKDAYILANSTDELVEYYYSYNNLQPIEIDLNRTEEMEHKKEVKTVKAQDRDPFYRGEGDLQMEFEMLTVSIPIIHNNDINRIKDLLPSVIISSWSPRLANFQSTNISFTIEIKGYKSSKTNDQIKREIDTQKRHILQWIDITNKDIRTQNAKIKLGIRQTIDARKAKILADQDRFASLVQMIDIPLKRKDDETIKRIQLDTKPLVNRIRPAANAPEEYQIDRNKVLDVIHFLDNQGTQFEKTPKTYQKSEEEDLRNVLLVNLNSIFEGRATGETFSNNGKSDIYLNINKGNILVSECKIWGGQQLYSDTIEQLLGYLTWRHNYGIMITFCRNKNFTRIMKEAQDAIKSHRSFKTGIQIFSETHFISQHSFTTDSMKNVEIHHLFYNLFYEKSAKLNKAKE